MFQLGKKTLDVDSCHPAKFGCRKKCLHVKVSNAPPMPTRMKGMDHRRFGLSQASKRIIPRDRAKTGLKREMNRNLAIVPVSLLTIRAFVNQQTGREIASLPKYKSREQIQLEKQPYHIWMPNDCQHTKTTNA